jgi:hypothetical protein
MKLVSMRAGLAALTLAGAAAAVPAFAQTTASAALTLVRYELVDLDLTDCVTPWLSFQDSWAASSQASLFPGASPNDWPVTLSTSWSGDVAEVRGDSYSARAQAGMDGVWSTAGGGPQLVSSTALTQRGFLLSPNTSVTFYFDAQLDAAPGDGANPAAAGMKVTFGTDSLPMTQRTVRNGESYSGSLTAYGEAYGTDAVQGSLWMATYTETYAAAAPVPEPAAPAMFVGGLALLAFGRRRR